MRKMLVLLVLAACGGSSPPPAQPETTTSPEPDPDPAPAPEGPVSVFQCFSNEMLALNECVQGTVEECEAAAVDAQAAGGCFVPTEVWCFDYEDETGYYRDCTTSEETCLAMEDMNVGAEAEVAEGCGLM